ncbi:MAG: glycoside hydrolase family 6 protein [Vampirovibrio sp.]|nr:glycoside hydrolase family 6 protein [Vampirovibrio sp.]
MWLVPKTYRQNFIRGVVLWAGFFLLMSPLAIAEESQPPLLKTDWTRSWRLYHHPHAIWLTKDDRIGANMGLLQQVLRVAEQRRQQPDVVIYTVPFRDLGQSSEGGFKTFAEYRADNQLLAAEIQTFVHKTGIHPRIYLEPDGLAHAIQYRRDLSDNDLSLEIYHDRIEATLFLINLYKKAGALVYLDAANCNWFDYRDEDVQTLANILNKAGIAQAHGLVVNVSNRNPLTATDNAKDNTKNTQHFLNRLLPLLENPHPDVVADTSRNGGKTHPRQYYLAPDGRLIDNEAPSGRWIGRWQQSDKNNWATITVYPFFGLPFTLKALTQKDKHTFNPTTMILQAPPWLDAVGDVQLGAPPSNISRVKPIHRYRFIKPPDDCDGGLNCPPGESRSRINKFTQHLQPAALNVSVPW